MNKEFKRMIKLAGLAEIKVNEPIPLFKTNDQLTEYLENNPKFKEKLIDAIFNSPDFNHSDDPSWDSVRQGWIESDIERFTKYHEADELMIDDYEDNRIYISVEPLKGFEADRYGGDFEVSITPNKFYCQFV